MGLRNFESVLFLDDMRVPSIFGISLVRNYNEFVDYLQTHEIPELISFDHDLALEHYPLFEEDTPGRDIPYHTYKEKTGKECAEFIVENHLPLRYWTVHSFNPVGRDNISAILRAYCPQGEIHDLRIPYRVVEHQVYKGAVVNGYRQRGTVK